jgi:hypothetical protein
LTIQEGEGRVEVTLQSGCTLIYRTLDPAQSGVLETVTANNYVYRGFKGYGEHSELVSPLIQTTPPSP